MSGMLVVGFPCRDGKHAGVGIGSDMDVSGGHGRRAMRENTRLEDMVSYESQMRILKGKLRRLAQIPGRLKRSSGSTSMPCFLAKRTRQSCSF